MYTVSDTDGNPIRSGLGAIEALEWAVTQDGKLFEIRRLKGGFYKIYTSERSENSAGGAGKMREWDVVSLKSPEGLAEEAISKYGDFDGWTVDQTEEIIESYKDAVRDCLDDDKFLQAESALKIIKELYQNT